MIITGSEKYVVTDPDLDLSDCPKNTLSHMDFIMESRWDVQKLGLSLKISDVPEGVLFFPPWETEYWKMEQTQYTIKAPVDTTFALYYSNKEPKKTHFIGGERLKEPYVAKHMPWYFTAESLKNNEEYMHYLKTCNHSSSYLMWLERHGININSL